ncbi:hypothetical protein IX84_28720 [Phaeodactylibacter xiamenensis]|uniref:Uncharacterized protein n=1 Tax=Phaeodactylibacter xiamenensis TaxID=1524460 RepID=A0A098S0Y4_9BACT|nr:hypothetical protein IX84_28720 [Phaeodactylibacter xiamenensis]
MKWKSRCFAAAASLLSVQGGITMWEEEKVINQNKKLPGPLPGRPIKKQQDIILDKHRPIALLPTKWGTVPNQTWLVLSKFYVILTCLNKRTRLEKTVLSCLRTSEKSRCGWLAGGKPLCGPKDR